MASDPLSLLRTFLLTKKPIVLLDSQQTTTEDISRCSFLQFGSIAYAKNALTAYKSKRGTSEHYQLDSVYFLALNSSKQHTEYMQECKKLGLAPVSFVDRKDLLQYINGTVEICPFLDANMPLQQSILIGGTESVEVKQSEEPETFEKASFVRNSLFLSKNKNYGDVLNVVKQVLKNEKTSKMMGADAGSKKIKTEIDMIANPMGLIQQISNANQSSKMSKKVESGSLAVPIVIVPSAISSLLTLYNVKEFLENEKFIPSIELKEKGATKEFTATINRSRNRATAVPYQIVDNIQRLKVEDWKRVVAVFVQGNTWQFKGWKWTNPIEIFSHVKGFYLKFDDTPLDESIKNWNVEILTISKSKRHLDGVAVMQFWDAVDNFVFKRKLKVNY